MKNQLKTSFKTLAVVLVSTLVVATITYAGNLTAPGSPGAQSYTLTDIYNKLTGAGSATAGNHSLSTTTAPASSMRTLSEIYAAIPSAFSQIFKTGQTHCNAFNTNNYDTANQIPCSGTNQDGEAQRGVVFSYTDNSDGTITDNATGLMWQKCSYGLSGSACETGSATTLRFGAPATVFPAINYCEALTLGGQSDWHLPNINELLSLVDYGRLYPAMDPTYFPNTPSSGIYWSSTAHEGNPFNAWIVYFQDGTDSNGDMSDDYHVRCVRSI